MSNYLNEKFILITHVFGEYPLGLQYFLNKKKLQLFKRTSKFVTIIPAEQKLVIKDQVFWGKINRLPLETLIMFWGLEEIEENEFMIKVKN